MMDQPDLFTWADAVPPKDAVIIDALPKLLAKIRLEQAYGIRRPTGGAVVLSMQRKAA